MIGNPLALLGLLAIAVPVLIHLLGRHRSRVQRFPTLRFIPVSRLAPSRRRTISDWPLLVVRAATVAIAAVALSQPYFACADRGAGSTTIAVSRAVVVDTSASMRRGGALDSARRVASARAGVVARIETDDPASGVREANAWLMTRDGTRELEIVSDFQAASFDSIVLAGVSADVGIELTRVPANGQAGVGGLAGITALSTPAIENAVATGWRAAGAAVPVDSAAAIALIYEGHTEARALAAAAKLADEPWMGRVVASIARDPLVNAAAGSLDRVSPVAVAETLAMGRSGQPMVGAGMIDDRLMIFVNDVGDGVAAVAVNRALIELFGVSRAESDTTSLSSAAIAALERPATPRPGAPTDQSDASLFWLAALLLIGVEALMRRRSRTPPATDDARPAGENNREMAA